MILTCRNNALLSGGANTAGQSQGCPTALQVPPLPLPTGLSGVGPVIESLPPTTAVTGQALQYQVTVFSANPASLAFSLASAPAGMTIDATSGLMAWTPGLNQAADQPVTVVAQDSNGQTSQSFTLSVFGIHVEVAVPISAAHGGVIAVDDPSSSVNGLSINIPAGALASDTTITIPSPESGS